MKLNRILIFLCALLLVATAVSATIELDPTNNTQQSEPAEETAAEEQAVQEQPTQQELTDELTNEEAKLGANDTNNVNSPFFPLAKLMVLEKAVKKARTTKAYLANKNKTEPLLKDIEKQISILKEALKPSIKSRVASLKAMQQPKKSFFSRMASGDRGAKPSISYTGGFFLDVWNRITGNAVAGPESETGTEGGGSITPPRTQTDAAMTTAKQTFLGRLFKGGALKKPAAPVATGKKMQAPPATGLWIQMDNQLKHLLNSNAFQNNNNAQAAITQIKKDLGELSKIRTQRPTQM